MKRAIFGLWLISAAASAQTVRLQTVVPSLPGKNNVRWWEFDWKWTDFSPVEQGAPVRLYFYESERSVAAVARPFIEQAYRDLVEVFDYRPTQRIPFLLYNSHFEFESTRAFFVSETVLGVTSTEDLTMALPYWGEHRRFEHVMRHELAHQFTIQKVVELGRRRGCNPLLGMPLWFIEGLAEAVSRPELTAEVRAALAQRAVLRDELPPFFSEAEPSFERIYLVGHAQVRFLEETYGRDTAQRILAASPRLCRHSLTVFQIDRTGDFAALVQQVTGDNADTIERRWRRWVANEVAPAERAEQSLDELRALRGIGPGEIDSLSLSPDGDVALYRTADVQTGVGRIFLRLLATGGEQMVTQDGRIGLDSLHPFDRRVTAIGDDFIVYVGRVGPADKLFVRRYSRKNGRLELGEVIEHRLSAHDDLIEAGWPAIHPRNGAVYFVGLSRSRGFLDIYRLDRPLEPDGPVTRVTDDPYAEQGLAFAPDGTLYLASDATPDGRYELFALRGRNLVMLTSFPESDVGPPSVDANGRVFFSSGESGLEQAYLYTDGALRRLTGVPTAFRQPAALPDGTLLGVVPYAEERHLAALSRDQWLNEPVAAFAAPVDEGVGGAGFEPWELTVGTLEPARDYNPLSPENLSLVDARAFATVGPFVLGRAVFADRFRTHLLGIAADVLGSFERSNARLWYLDQSGRLSLGGGVFVATGLQLAGDPEETLDTFLLQRIGGAFQVSWPFNRYVRLDSFIAPQALRVFDFTDPDLPLAQRIDGAVPALESGMALALDTLRLSPVGPVDGLAVSLSLRGTATMAQTEPFGELVADVHGYKTLLGGYERVFVHARLALGATFGGVLREEFYVPASYNLRALPPNSLRQLGQHYALGQLELQFPLAPELGGIFLQGVAGADAGSVFFDFRQPLGRRVAAAVLGADVVLGPIALRLHFARPIDIGAGVAAEGWIPHASVSTPFMLF